MEKVRRYIEGCHGIIVLGLERSHAYFYRDKEGSEKELEATHRRYSSAWLQLETGMAIGMGKDVFVLCRKIFMVMAYLIEIGIVTLLLSWKCRLI